MLMINLIGNLNFNKIGSLCNNTLVVYRWNLSSIDKNMNLKTLEEEGV